MRLSWIGWVATAVFASSYLFKHSVVLRRVQGGAAILWVIYGPMINAFPVVVANLLVASMALYSSCRRELAVTKENRHILPVCDFCSRSCSWLPRRAPRTFLTT